MGTVATQLQLVPSIGTILLIIIAGLAKCPLEKQTHSHWSVETLLHWLEISAHQKKFSEIQPSAIHKANYN